MVLNFGKTVKSWCGVIFLDMLCGVIYGVLDCWCAVEQAVSFSKVSGYVTLVGILRGKMIHGFGFLFLLYCRGLLCFYGNLCLSNSFIKLLRPDDDPTGSKHVA
jgi:hypothetical protein